MNLLLTSAGIQNQSLKRALEDLLPKPIKSCRALCISTSSYALPNGAELAYDFYTGKSPTPMCELGWKSIGILELTACDSMPKEQWMASLKAADVLLVNGGDPLYLSYWMEKSGFSTVLPKLDIVYVGLSAGSMIMAPKIGVEFIGWQQPSGDDQTLGIVDFAIFPHLNNEMLKENTIENAEKWAKSIGIPAYAIDDQTGIKVTESGVEIISEGTWIKMNS